MKPIPTLATLATLSAAAMPVGCANKPSNQMLVGSWEGRASAEEQPFSFGSVTFAPSGDSTGTYTAEARYDDTTRVQTGHFVITENGLVKLRERKWMSS